MVILPNAQAFEAALAARRPQRIRVVFAEGTADEVEFGNDMISSMAGVTFHSSVNSETNLAIGLCPAAQVSFTIINNNPNVDLSGFEFGEAHIYLGVQLLDGNWQDVSMGYFIVQRPDVVKKRLIEVSAMDRMTLFDVDWPAGITITTSTTLRSLAQAMCDHVGIPLSSATFLNESITARQVPSDLSNKTMREVLAWIAEAAGSIARINRNGQLEFFWYDSQNIVAQIDENNYTEFSPSWFATPAIDKLVIRNADSTDQYESGTGDTVYIIQDNPFLRQSGTETVQTQTNTRGLRALRDTPTTPEAALYNRLSTAPVYHPYGVTTFLDWRYEAGDMLQISSDETAYTEPIYNLDFTWNGDIVTDLSATGEQTRPPLSPLRRREYSFRGGISGATKLAEDAVQYSTDFTQDDYGIGLLAKAVGVAIDTDPTSVNYGKPKVDATTGKYVFDANGASLTGQINVTAENITLKTGISNLSTGETLYSRISSEADRIDLVVEKKNGQNVIKTASIITAINNDSTSTSHISLSADYVYIDANKTFDVGRCFSVGQDGAILTTNTVNAGKLQVGSSQNSGDMDVYGSADFYGTSAQVTFQNGFRIGSSSPYKTIDANFNPVNTITLTPPAAGSDTYTLSYTDYAGVSHEVGTFSRAASQVTLSGVWSGSGSGTGNNVFTVTPSPSGTPLTETLSYTIGQFGSVSHTANVTIRASSITEQSQDPSAYLKQLQVNATSVYTGGWDAAEDKLVWPSYGAGLSTLIKYPDRGASASSTSGTSADQSAKMVLLTDDSTNNKVTCRIGGTVVAECPYSGGGGATVRNVKLLENIGGVLEEVVSPVTVNSSRTVFPRVTLSDNTTVDGSSYTFNPHSGGYVFGSETFTGNGTYRADSYGYDGFTSVTVAVPGAATLGAK